MGSKSSQAATTDDSHEAFLQGVQYKPPGFISEGRGLSLVEERNISSVPLKHQAKEASAGELEAGDGENDFFEPSDQIDPFETFLKRADTHPPESRDRGISKEQAPPSFTDSLLIELVHRTKNTLASIYHASLRTVEKPDDPETRKLSHLQIKDDIQKIDTVLNSLLNFISVNTPIAKTNSLYIILEEIVEANEKQLREKNIKIVKKCEKDLPDTYIHNEQVRFILNSILQYVIISTPRNETIGFLMKALDFHDAGDAEKDSWEKKKGYVEVVVGFDGDAKLVNPIEQLSKLPEDQRHPSDLILLLVNETLARNRGSMTIESNGKRPKTLITLRFPIERRNVVYYEPITL